MSDYGWFLGFAAGTVVVLLLAKMLFKPYFWRITAVIVPLAFSGWVVCEAWDNYTHPGKRGFKFNLGVDLAGGTILVYEAVEGKTKDFDAPALAAALKKRIDPANTKEIVIRPVDSDPPRVEIILPMKSASGGQAAADIAEIKEIIGRVGKLEFRILADSKDAESIKTTKDLIEKAGASIDLNDIPAAVGYEWIEFGDESLDRAEESAKKLGYTAGFNHRDIYPVYFVPDAVDAKNPEKRRNRFFVLTIIPAEEQRVLGEHLGGIRQDFDPRGGLAVNFTVNSPSDAAMSRLTSPNVDRQLATVMDDQVMSHANIKQALSHSIQVTFGSAEKLAETQKRVASLIRVLRAGALPTTLKREPVSQLEMGAALGADTVRDGTRAVIIALVGVVVFMCVYYHYCGVVASIGLFANLLFTVAFMVAVKATFTLPGLAGLVLTLGMAVDANVLIYERMREERDRGASLALAIRNGYDRAFPTIIDTHLTSIFTAIVLYAVGNDQLKGFGVSLTAGLIISLFTSLFITRLLFDISMAKGLFTRLSMFKIMSNANYNFMKWRYHWLAGTVAVSVFGLAMFLFRGEDGLNIDFNGGTAYALEFKEPKPVDEIRKRAESAVDPNDPNKLKDVTVEAISREGFGGDQTTMFTFRTSLRKEWKKQGEEREDRQVKEVQRILTDLFRGEIIMVEPKAGEVQPLEKHPRFNRQVEFTFGNRNMAETSVSTIVNSWLAKQQIARPDEHYEVKGVEGEKDSQGLYPRLNLRFKLPEEITANEPNAEQGLASLIVQTLHAPRSERLENFDPQLAGQVQLRALIAIALSWLAILMYLWFRFGNWTFGMAAVLCLLHDLAFTIGLIGISHYIVSYTPVGGWLLLEDFKIDLPAVAALLTLIGYSVNDTIVVFDRIREVRGKSPELTPKMINDSVNQTLSRSLITSFTVFVVVFILYVLGGEGIHLFSFVMVVGVVVGSYSSIFVASPLLLIFGEGKTAHPVRQELQTAEV
jgi:SecD/SecF fusion protein